MIVFSWLLSLATAQMECPIPEQCYYLQLPSDQSNHLFVFLHGLGDTAENFARASIVQTVRQELSKDYIPTSYLMIPEGERGYWMNWMDGEHLYEEWTIRNIRQVKKDYDIEEITLVGVSMGSLGNQSVKKRRVSKILIICVTCWYIHVKFI